MSDESDGIWVDFTLSKSKRQSIQQNAEQESILYLTDDHWLVIQYICWFYERFQDFPAISIMVRDLNRALSTESDLNHQSWNSLKLRLLFPHPTGMNAQIARIAGVPKPRHCL